MKTRSRKPNLWLYASCDNDGNIKNLMAGDLESLRLHAKQIILDILGEEEGDCPDEDAEAALRESLVELDQLTDKTGGSWLIRLANFDALGPTYGTMLLEQSKKQPYKKASKKVQS